MSESKKITNFNFVDSLQNLYNGLANTRNATYNNRIVHNAINYSELRAIYRTGLGSKIVRLKAGYALKDTLQFDNTKDEIIYKQKFEKAVKRAARYMVGFGRGIIVLYNKGEDMSMPARNFDPAKVEFKVFSADLVTSLEASIDLMNPRYFKPRFYSVKGVQFHYSRVIDFTYIEPTEFDAAIYQYGGVSEFELIYTQLVNDGVVERCTPAVLEKNSTLFYKIVGLKDAMQDQRDEYIRRYFVELENARSVYGAGLLDSEDDAFSVNQTLTNLQEADSITLRRLAMVTGIPLAILVGENVKGLNSTGDNEMRIFQDMIEVVQSDFLEQPINELFAKLGLGVVSFKDNQGRTPDERIQFETQVIQNATALYNLGEDYSKYLEDNAVIVKDKYVDFFFPEEAQPPEVEAENIAKEISAVVEGSGESTAENLADKDNE